MAMIATAKRRRADNRRPLHNDEARSLQMLDKALGDDRRHDLGGVMLPPAAVEAQRERESVGEVFGGGGREAVGRVGHAAGLARRGNADRRWRYRCFAHVGPRPNHAGGGKLDLEGGALYSARDS
jgi:hypothetical protein